MNKNNPDQQHFGSKIKEHDLLKDQSFIKEVTERFGLVPNFFRATQPYIARNLWNFTQSAYLDNPLPSLFKERLCVHLSRFFQARYWIVRHVGFLIGLGNPAGDPSAAPQPVEQVIELLKRPIPDAVALKQLLTRLESYEQPLEMPTIGTQQEFDLFDALTIIFLEPQEAERARIAVRKATGETNFEYLTALLAFLHTTHFWTESTPNLAYEPDVAELLAQNSTLAKLLLNPIEVSFVQTNESLKHALTELADIKERESETAYALSKSEEKYRSLFNSIDEGFVLYDVIYDAAGHAVDLVYREVNPAFKAISGLTNVIGKTAYELNPSMESYWLDTAAHVAASGKSERLEAYVKGVDRWLDVCFMRLQIDTQYVVAALFNDVTGRKRSEINGNFLAEISNDFTLLESPDDILQAAATKIGKHFKLTRCFFADIHSAQKSNIIYDWHLEGTPSLNYKSALPLKDLIPDECHQTLTNGEVVIINDTHLDTVNNLGGCALLNSQAYIMVPVTENKRLCFVACILYPFARTWRKDEIHLIKELTERIWLRLGRARAEQQLKYREAELTRVQEIGGVGGVDIDIKSGLRSWRSAEYLRLHGLPPNTSLETHDDWLKRLHPDDRELANDVLQEALRLKQKSYKSEYRIIRPNDGNVRWILAKADIEFDNEGQPVRLIGAHIDITERKLVEETQRESEARQAFLVRLNDALRPLADPRQIQATASRMIGEYLDVNCASYSEIDGDSLVVNDAWIRGIKATTNTAKFADFGKVLIDEYKKGRTVTVVDVENDERFSDEERMIWRKAEIRSSLAVMLIKNDKWIAVFGVQCTEPRKWTASEIELIEDIADRTWANVERVQAEEALRRSEQQFRAVVNLIPDMLWLNDRNGSSYWYNERWLSYTGQTLEEAVNYGWVNAVHPDDQDQSLLIFQSAIYEGQPLKQEHRIRSSEGEYRWFLIQAVPIHNKTGEIWQWIGAATDINERKEAEKQLEQLNMLLEQQVADQTYDLQENQQLLTATLNSTRDLIQVFEAVRDENGNIVDFIWLLNNESSSKRFGNVIGKSLLKHNPSVVAEGIFQSYIEVTETGITQQYEKHHLQDQADTWVRHSVAKLNDGVATSTADITERKLSEQKLQETNNLLQSVFDTTLIGMALHRAERDENGQVYDFRIQMVNQELERLTGRNDLVGKLYGEEFPGIKKTVVFNAMQQVMQTGRPMHIEYSYPHDGFDKWFSSMFVKMNDGLVATNLDITERKVAEQERFKSLTLLQETEEVALLGSWEYNLLTAAFNWSDGMYRLFDLPKDMLTKPDIYVDYAVDTSIEQAKRIVERIKTGNGDFEDELEIMVNNKPKILKIKATLIGDEEGKPVKVLGIDIDITATRLVERKIREIEIQNQQEVFRATLNTQEEERRRIAESLHNGLGQLLYGVKLSLDQINLNRTDRISDNTTAMQQTKRLLSDSIKETRRISHELMPSILEDFGLKEALEDVCRQLSGATVHFHCEFLGINNGLDKYIETAIYRIVQELMINVIKHAQATRASARIEVNDNEIILTVEDNGKGFDTSKIKTKGIGLPSIRSKVNLLNGKVNISSSVDFGSTITISIPNKKSDRPA